MNLRPSSSIELVPGQSEVHGATLFQKLAVQSINIFVLGTKLSLYKPLRRQTILQTDHVTEQHGVALNTLKFHGFEFRRSNKTF